jgi:exonuclease III
MKWLPISERIVLVRFKTKIRNLTVIQCYGPTEMTEKEKEEEFYQQLSETIATATKRDVIIVVGNMNAKVGSNNEGLEHVMGRHGMKMMSCLVNYVLVVT